METNEQPISDNNNGVPAFDLGAIIPQSKEEMPTLPAGALPLVHTGAPRNLDTPEEIAEKEYAENEYIVPPQPVIPDAPLPINPSGDVNAQLVEIIEQLRGEVQQLSAQVNKAPQAAVEDGGGESGFPWMYYKRARRGPEAGWVTIGPGGSASPGGNRRDMGSYALYTHKGMKPLTEYGVIAPPKASAPIGAEFITLLSNGGAREFPVAQVLAYRWHIDPPVAGLIFPQVDEARDHVCNFACDECDFDIWFLDDDRYTAKACFQHLTRQHDYPRREASLALEAQQIRTVAPFAVQAANDVPEIGAEKETYGGL